MLSLTAAYGLEDFIDRIKKMPIKFLESRVINFEYSIWSRINRTLKSWLYSSIIPAMNSYIVKYTIPISSGILLNLFLLLPLDQEN